MLETFSSDVTKTTELVSLTFWLNKIKLIKVHMKSKLSVFNSCNCFEWLGLSKYMNNVHLNITNIQIIRDFKRHNFS